MHYLEFLGQAHEQVKPKLYFEIGVRHGRSLALSRSKSYGVDPAYKLNAPPSSQTELFRMTSDEFFARADIETLFEQRADMSFIDGMHLFEFALRDFANIESMSQKNGIVFFDDVFPRSAEEAVRDRTQRKVNAWTGDIWKILPCLARFRSDLLLVPVNTKPTGILIVCNLDPANKSLKDRYAEIVGELNSEAYANPPPSILNRDGAVEPRVVLKSNFLSKIALALDNDQRRKITEELKSSVFGKII